MNFHSDNWINEQVRKHYNEGISLIDSNNFVGIFLQGSQNYGLDFEGSDVDTKMLVTPSLDDLVFARQPISTTHIRENDEHIDIKDIRLYIQLFKKVNLNFLEILFTKYYIINPLYKEDWDVLIENREKIARVDNNKFLKALYGFAAQKYSALEHPYPSKLNELETYGYDPKQLHHMVRLKGILDKFLADYSLEECLKPYNESYLRELKEGKLSLEEARELANSTMDYIKEKTHEEHPEYKIDEETCKLLDQVQANIIRKSLKNSL